MQPFFTKPVKKQSCEQKCDEKGGSQGNSFFRGHDLILPEKFRGNIDFQRKGVKGQKTAEERKVFAPSTLGTFALIVFLILSAPGYNPLIMLQAKVTIVGLGLMGGSLALSLRLAQRVARRPYPTRITIVDSNLNTLAAAERLADVVTADFAEGVKDAELVILATPVRTVLALLNQLAEVRPTGCMVLDLGSTKRDICAVMDMLPAGFEAIGGHPMCGKETAGFSSATPDLYRDKTFVLCRSTRTTERVEALVLDLLNIVGANPLFLPPDVHDEMVAAISHLPYVVAGSLMRTAAAVDDDRLWQVSASGFRDTSRVSGTDPKMMLDILLTNKTAVLQQLQRYQDEITAVTHLLESDDEAALSAWLTETQREYFTYRKKKEK
jgi:prephenate dehydrogenase